MQVLFDGNKTATGVKAESAGRTWTLTARKEVIVSAGVMHSPQLLMVSGVGPRKTLEQHNISMVADRPGVGQNMHDSCNVGGVSFPLDVISTAIRQRDAGYEAQAETLIRSNGSGILTNTGGDVLSFEKLPEPYRSGLSNDTLDRLADWPKDWPEVEFVLSSSGETLEGASATGETTYLSAFFSSARCLEAISRFDQTPCMRSLSSPPTGYWMRLTSKLLYKATSAPASSGPMSISQPVPNQRLVPMLPAMPICSIISGGLFLRFTTPLPLVSL